MAYTQIKLDIADGIATITLHRPEKMNAFTGVMIFGPAGSAAYTVPVLSFLLGVTLRRVKQGLDSALVWPFIESLIDWTMVNSLAGGRYERAEFN